VVLAHGLKPKRLNADGPLADLAVPDEESWGELLPADLRPAQRVDEKAEHVLLTAVESRRAVESLLRRLEVRCELGQ
jgi:hypothetical protein